MMLDLLRREPVETLLDDHQSRRQDSDDNGRNLDFHLWDAHALELWCRTFLDRDRKAGAGTSRRPSDSAPIGLARGRHIA